MSGFVEYCSKWFMICNNCKFINKYNFRPIKNVAFSSKCLERLASFTLVHHLSGNNLFVNLPVQSAYRSTHSTETALLRVYNDLLLAVDAGDAAVLVLLDFSAAFDTIDHSILLRRLESTFVILWPGAGMDAVLYYWQASSGSY
jgi:hypothetical protein